MSENNRAQVALVVAGATSFGVVCWYLRSLHRKYAAMEEAYWAERRGRTRVEQEMRKLANVQLNTSEGFFVQPVGVVESCYRQCVGTPRQGMLVPSSRASIVLTSNMSAEAFDGLEEFSHVWLTFKFHLNTNSLKEAKAFQGVVTDLSPSRARGARAPGNQAAADGDGDKEQSLADADDDKPGAGAGAGAGPGPGKKKFTFTAKITPPMLKEKKGVLATRSPHRPNPIGVTLARIDRVDMKGRRLYVTACDLVHGTPILDIKPYVPMYDSVTWEEGGGGCARVPQWIMETIDTRNIVTVHADVLPKVQRIARKLKQYRDEPEVFLRAAVETLEADVRSKFQTQRRIRDSAANVSVDVPFDDATVCFLWKDLRTFEITDVYLTPKSPRGLETTAERTVAEVEALSGQGGQLEEAAVEVVVAAAAEEEEGKGEKQQEAVQVQVPAPVQEEEREAPEPVKVPLQVQVQEEKEEVQEPVQAAPTPEKVQEKEKEKGQADAALAFTRLRTQIAPQSPAAHSELLQAAPKPTPLSLQAAVSPQQQAAAPQPKHKAGAGAGAAKHKK